MNTTSKLIIRTIMAARIKGVVAGALLMVATVMVCPPALAQDHEAHPMASGQEVITGKKGQLHFTTQVKAGDAILKPGMYQVQHVTEGGDHVLIFKEVGMQGSYKMGNTPVGKEVARIKCKIVPVTNKVSNTKITLRTIAAGEKEIAEVQVAGEAFKRVL